MTILGLGVISRITTNDIDIFNKNGLDCMSNKILLIFSFTCNVIHSTMTCEASFLISAPLQLILNPHVFS